MSEIPAISFVYLAHPYKGDDKNVIKAGIIGQNIRKKYPDWLVFSPIHNWIYLGYEENRLREMADCLSMLSRCDMLILSGDWKHSTGCLMEYIHAMDMDIPVYEWNGEDVQTVQAPLWDMKKAPEW